MFGHTSEESIQVIKDWTLCGKFPNEILPRGKGAAAFKTTYITDEWFWRNDSNCIKTDYTIYRFLLPFLCT